MKFTDDEEGHNPELLLFWIVKNNNGAEQETGIRVLVTLCTDCHKPLKLYAHCNVIPWTF